MTPLDRLAAVLARMTEGPWSEEVIGSALRYFRKCGPDVSDLAGYSPAWRWPHGDDAAGIAALRNLAPLLIDVVRAARTAYAEQWHPPATEVERRLGDAITALDSAITKELGG